MRKGGRGRGRGRGRVVGYDELDEVMEENEGDDLRRLGEFLLPSQNQFCTGQ